MVILAIETSCDETAISIAEFFGSKTKPTVKVLSSIVSSQVKLHAKYGGVVPNLAKREHQKNLVPILLRTLEEAHLLEKYKIQNTNRNNQIKIILERETELLKKIRKYIVPLKPPLIDTIAVTHGPGLAPALWVGVNFARALAYLWEKPIIPVNHMEGHLFSALLRQSGKEKLPTTNYQLPALKFPALALLVSGGHTELVLVRGFGKYKIIGETLDDAAGEAFDKVARILGLEYPGGPAISASAEMKFQNSPPRRIQGLRPSEVKTFTSDSNLKFKIKLPRPMINSKDYNFSFSGLKTAVLYLVRDLKSAEYSINKIRPAVAKEFQNAVVEVLVKKTIRAAGEYKVKTVLLGGGVAANTHLREELGKTINKEIPNSLFLIPDSLLAGDNALIIALAAYFSRKEKTWSEVHVDANLRL